jgi:hypothetical protein
MSRTSLVLLLLLGLSLLTVSHNALAQSEGFFACGIAESFAYFMITVFVYYIVLLMWVAQDAKSRGMDNIVMWVLVVACLGYVGMIIYLILRPRGPITIFPSCGRKRLRRSTTCLCCGSA